MPGSGESAHVDADFEIAFYFGIDVGDRCGERVHVLQVHAQQKAMPFGNAPLRRRFNAALYQCQAASRDPTHRR